ncbi:MAG: hypothetical protein IKZ96_02445 [Bacilli bacterium]|nr:hypothetical protein [Bacilli bacterium]
MQNKEGLTTAKKVIILSMMSFIAVLLLIVAIILPGGTKKKLVNSRTIMIFMAGTNLESESYLASSDLNGIVPENIDLNTTKVLLYTGGTKKWHNFVSSTDEGIYELTNNGFVKAKSFTKSNLGYDTALANFLNYAYEYSKTDAYDLIFWDHGLGALGSISDENTNDYLDLSEMTAALQKSPFDKENKLETVVFRTCLNSTLEVASTFAPYADYMVASEEITLGKYGHGVLKFLNSTSIDSDAVEYGEAFIASYQKQIEEIDVYGETDSTYAIIDLSTIEELNTMIDSFFSKIDARKNYNELARMRSTMHQYAAGTMGVYDYDTVDLYELIDNLKKYDEKESTKIEKYLKEKVIVYNWSTNTHSNGLSVYFPYYGDNYVKNLHFDLYKKLNVSDNYSKFITDFNKGQTSTSYSFTFDLSNTEVKQDGKEFKLKLTNEQVKNFSKANYMIFKKEEDGKFSPIFTGLNATLDKDGYLSTNITDNLISVYDGNDKTSELITAIQIESQSKDYKEYTVPVVINKINDEGWPIVQNANIHIKVDKKGKVHIAEVYILDKAKSNEDINKTRGTLVDLKDYSSIDFSKLRYDILDSEGKFTTDWKSNGTLYFWEVKTNNYKIETTSLDSNGDYYCVFAIRDVQNNVYYSNLISIK